MRNLKKGPRSQAEGLHRERTLALLRRELASIFDGELHDRDLEGLELLRLESKGATLTVWVSSSGPLDRVSTALGRARSFIHQELFENVEMKRFPDLRFRLVRKPVSADFEATEGISP
jgi:ribosome-binding factor A